MAEPQLDFSDWAAGDAKWKSDAMSVLMSHGERLTKLETISQKADNAESAAATTKKWAVIGGAVAALINGFLLVFGNGGK